MRWWSAAAGSPKLGADGSTAEARSKGRTESWTAAAPILALGAVLATLVVAEPSPGHGTLEGWSSLTLAASKAVIFSAQATLEVSDGAWSGNGKPAIVFKTRSEARLFGAAGFREETTSWIDRSGHRPLEFFQIRPGENAKRYLFLDGSVRQTTWEPPASRPDSEFSDWREVETIDRKLTYADGTAPRPGETFTDFYSLIYLLRDLDLASQQAPKEFSTLYRRHLVRLRVVPAERRRREREAVNEASGATETLKLRERRIVIRPLGEGAASFRGLMGMQGDTEIWMDEASGALLEVDGEAPGLGSTQVLLASFRR